MTEEQFWQLRKQWIEHHPSYREARQRLEVNRQTNGEAWDPDPRAFLLNHQAWTRAGAEAQQALTAIERDLGDKFDRVREPRLPAPSGPDAR